MSFFYQVMGAANQTRCQKFKKHPGFRLVPMPSPNGPAPSPYTPGYKIIYVCETTETKQTIECLDDGRWSDVPNCPDPTNNSCKDPGIILNGSHNGTGQYKVGTILQFKCDYERIPQIVKQNLTNLLNDGKKTSARLTAVPFDVQNNSTTIRDDYISTPATTLISDNTNFNEVDAITTLSSTTPSDLGKPSKLSSLATPVVNSNQLPINSTIFNQLATPQYTDTQNQIKYNLTGQRYLRCLPSSKWSDEFPTCAPILPEKESNLKFILTSAFLIIIPILILIVIAQLFIKWRKRQQQRARWKQYFTDYKYRHSKSSIAFGMKNLQNNNNPTIPITDL